MGGVTCAIVGYKVTDESFNIYASNFGLQDAYPLKRAIADHICSILSTPVTLVFVDTDTDRDCMLCCVVIQKSVYDCSELLATEVPPAFERLPTLIGTEGGLRRIVVSKAVVSASRPLDG